MLLGGDEIGRTQNGNNNAYCQDSEISWLDWEKADNGLLELCRCLISLRKEHPVFRRRRWFQGRPIHGGGIRDIGWFKPDGREMTDADWQSGSAKSLGVFLNGEGLTSPDAKGNRIVDDTFYLLFNAYHEAVPFKLPARDWGRRWAQALDTGKGFSAEGGQIRSAGEEVEVSSRALVLLRRVE